MKLLITLFLSLATASAMACPDLSGNFKCQPLNTGDTGINSVQVDGNTYTFILQDYLSKTVLIADGKSHDMDNGMDYKCTCSQAELICIASADGYSSSLNFSLDSKKDLAKKTTSVQNGQTTSDEEVCSRL